MERRTYLNYPPGGSYLIYGLSLLSGKEPTLELTMGLNLAIHLLVTLCTAAIVYSLLLTLQVPLLAAFGLSLVPIAIILFSAGPLYWFQNSYFHEQSAGAAFAVFLLLEVQRAIIYAKRKSLPSWLRYLQAAVAFFGCFCDYFFWLVMPVAFAMRVLRGEIGGQSWTAILRAGIAAAAPLFAAAALYLSYLANMDGLKALYGRFFIRTGMTDTTKDYFKTFWDGHLGRGFSPLTIQWFEIALYVLAFLLVVEIGRNLLRKRSSDRFTLVLSVSVLMLFPTFATVFILKQHAAIHGFTVLKFSAAAGAVPWILLPALGWTFWTDRFCRPVPGRLVAGLWLAVAFWTTQSVVRFGINEYPALFPTPTRNFEGIGRFIRANATYDDIFFSAWYEVPATPPQQMIYAMKRVYLLDQLSTKSIRIPKDDIHYAIKVITDNQDDSFILQELLPLAKTMTTSDPLWLHDKVYGSLQIHTFEASQLPAIREIIAARIVAGTSGSWQDLLALHRDKALESYSLPALVAVDAGMQQSLARIFETDEVTPAGLIVLGWQRRYSKVEDAVVFEVVLLNEKGPRSDLALGVNIEDAAGKQLAISSKDLEILPQRATLLPGKPWVLRFKLPAASVTTSAAIYLRSKTSETEHLSVSLPLVNEPPSSQP